MSCGSWPCVAVEQFEPAQQFTFSELSSASSVPEKLTFQDLVPIIGDSPHQYVREPNRMDQKPRARHIQPNSKMSQAR